MSTSGWARLSALVVLGSLAGGCAVYSTPSGDVVAPAPVVVAPPTVVVSPFGYFGGYRHYHRPHHHAHRFHGHRHHGPRYYGRPYYHY